MSGDAGLAQLHCSTGASSRQGTHQLAKKLTTTGADWPAARSVSARPLS